MSKEIRPPKRYTSVIDRGTWILIVVQALAIGALVGVVVRYALAT